MLELPAASVPNLCSTDRTSRFYDLTPPARGTYAARPVEIHVTMDEFRFDPSIIEIPASRPVRIIFVNRGEAEHEAVVGGERVQESHEAGDHRGGQMVSVPPGERRSIDAGPADVGTLLLLGCHLPGHYGQGMLAEMRVVAAPSR